MTHIRVSSLTIIGSDNGLSPGRGHANISKPMLEYCLLASSEETPVILKL